MKFRRFVESVINRDKATALVMNAVGAEPSDPDQRSDVLGSLIRHHPDLSDRLSGYAELKPYITQIQGFMHSAQNKTLQQLIDFIEQVGDPTEPQAQPPVSVSTGNSDSPI